MNRCLSQLPCPLTCSFHSEKPNNDYDIGQHSDTKVSFNVFFVVGAEHMERVMSFQSCTAHAYRAICYVMRSFFQDQPGLVRSFFPVEERFRDQFSTVLSKFNVGFPVLRRNSINVIVKISLTSDVHRFVMDDTDTIEQSNPQRFSPTLILRFKGSLFTNPERISFRRPFYLRDIRD